ncbi:hypothetical protein Vretimale_2220 [Volvox reticuliferus]|uniref:Uncharacterized protein n=1 Tax=Volvox reticuliferus TaxID=1737510 RepID=A0A8J4D603_9CHLO|nr:hypothetical protein Vretifemale_4523 [Volvox reticuliferus]GIL96362.1 hypothetical protein Vretimale_2220 [Volvox reticuliferus]
MGIWKRVTEKTKQAMGLKANSAEWRATSNARNLAMIEEARRFSRQLKILHRELKEMESRIDASFGVLKTVLNAPLPRAYELTDKGPVPVEKEASIVGAGVSIDTLNVTTSELKSKLQLEVLSPLEQWQSAFRMIKIRNVKCEELRLELDAKRREASTMALNLEKQKSKANMSETDKAAAEAIKNGGPPPGMASSASTKWEDAEFKLLKEEDKVARLNQRYRDIEEEVYTALLTLINDTKVLKQYAATALVVFQQTYGQAYTAFGIVPMESMPLPTTSSSAAVTPTKAPSSLSGRDNIPPAPALIANAKGGPDTPVQVPPHVKLAEPQLVPSAPAWYTEAKQHAQPINYGDDSDEDS